jgi:hypothetical protein
MKQNITEVQKERNKQHKERKKERKKDRKKERSAGGRIKFKCMSK